MGQGYIGTTPVPQANRVIYFEGYYVRVNMDGTVLEFTKDIDGESY